MHTEEIFTSLSPRRSYIGGFFEPGNIAGLSHVQLFNPLGSNVYVILERAIYNNGASTIVDFRRAQVALATLSTQSSPKAFGGIAPRAEVRHEINAVAQGVLIGNMRNVAGDNTPLLGMLPLVCYPGFGFQVVTIVVNQSLAVMFEWSEIDVQSVRYADSPSPELLGAIVLRRRPPALTMNAVLQAKELVTQSLVRRLHH